MPPERWLYTIPLRFRSLFRRAQTDHDLDDELRDHVERKTQENIARGLTPLEARRQALLDLRGIEQTKEACRDTRHITWLQDCLQDLRFGLRMLRKSPGFTAIAVLTLALGIGANTAIFSVVDSVLLKPLPYPGLERMVFVNEALQGQGEFSDSWPDFLDWREQNRVFERMAAIRPQGMTVLGGGDAKHAFGAFVSSSFFPILGTKPALGRVFTEADDHPGARAVAVISYSFWREALSGDRSCIGRTLSVDGLPVVVAGVLRADFQFPDAAYEIYLPIGLTGRDPEMMTRSNHPIVSVIATRSPGVSLAKAEADMNAIMARLSRQYPTSDRDESAVLTPFLERVMGNIGKELFLLFGAVGLVLLLACVNVTHMALARMAGRQHEFALRRALGASGPRLCAQVLSESLLLAVCGGVAGLLMARWTVRPLIRMYPQSQAVPGLAQAHLTPLALGFSLAVCVLAAAIFGLAPCRQAACADLSNDLKAVNGGGTETRSHRRLRSAFFVAEVAIALILSVGAGLTVKSLASVLRVNPGFRSDNLLSLSVIRAGSGSPGVHDLQFFSAAAHSIRQLPGVQSVSAVMCPPLAGTQWTSPFVPAGHPAPPLNQQPWTALNMVLPDYFETMRSPLLQGRFLNGSDDAAGRPVAVVNQTMARFLDSKGSAVGKLIHVEYAEHPLMEIVGVISDMKQWGLEQPDMPEVYVPAAQMPVRFMTIVVRTSVPPDTLVHQSIAAVQSLDRNQPVFGVASFDQIIDGLEGQRTFVTLLLGLFSALALLLAAIGVFGVMAYSVAQRTREFGIRLALGAQRSSVLAIVIREGLLLVGVGVAIGIGGALALTRFLRSLLFQIQPTDPATFVAVAILLTLVALLACYIPARRAIRIDPVSALRCE